MAQLVIKGHLTRGKEVIEIFEMLEGINKYSFCGNDQNGFYYIDGKSIIQVDDCPPLDISKVFTLEEFLLFK